MSSCPVLTTPLGGASVPSPSAYDGFKRAVAAVLSNVWMLLLCKGVIGVAAAFDTYLTIKYVQSLETYELNPLGRWLMDLDTGPVAQTQQIAAFITAKFLGTLIVLLTIQGLAFWRIHVAGLVAIPVAAFQLSLVMHLVFAGG